MKDNRNNEAIQTRTVVEIPLDAIRPNPMQPRKRFFEKSLMNLAKSIATVGLLQPILVRRLDDSHYEIIAGERRYRACHICKKETIPAIVQEKGYNHVYALAAIMENLEREDLNMFDEAESYKKLIKDMGITQEQLAVMVSKDQSTIANKMRVLGLSMKVREKVLEAGLSERHARAILRLHDEKRQLELIEKIKEESLSVRQTEVLVEKLLEKMYAESGAANEITKRKRGTLTDPVKIMERAVREISGNGGIVEMESKENERETEIIVRIKRKQ